MMNILRGVMGAPSAGPQPSGAETIQKLCDRVASSTLLDDRRDAVRALKSLSKKYRLEVGSQAMEHLINVLQTDRSDSEIIGYALDTLYNVISNDVEEQDDNSQGQTDDLGSQFAEILIKQQDNITLLLSLLEEFDFQVRWPGVKLLTTLLKQQGPPVQQIILVSPMGVSRLMDLLADSREVIRNDGLLLSGSSCLWLQGEGNMQASKVLLGRARTLLDSLWLWRQAVCSPVQPSTILQEQKSFQRNICTSCTQYAKRQRLGKDRDMSEKKLTRYFVDHRRISVFGGHGGKGSSCFHSEPRKEYGGPDGGDGGDGGHVILKVDQQVKSLASLQSLYRGIDGEGGGSKNCFGCNGANMYIKVPPGTLVKENGKIVADLSQLGAEYVAAFGGSGGKGNRFFLSNENRAPTMAEPGQLGQERVLHLELKTMAHAGLVGFPNAGKSSLLRAISNAKPAVAAYPFTTLNPHVGIVQYQDHEQVAVADIPGIISGAHQNRGLGFAFLRHIERCRFLLYVLDLSTSQPWAQVQELKYELEQYEDGLSKRPHAIVGNKMDLPQSLVNLPLLRERVEEKVIPVSALTGQNVEQLILHLRELYDSYAEKERAQMKTPLRW